MKREYSKILKGLLEKWDDASTMHFIDCKGISSRNWRIQCLEAGVVDGHKWKQREIAQEYNMTVARISKILESVRVRLSDSVEENCRIGLIREYRARLHRFLRENPVLNATFGAVLRDVGKTPYILPSGAVGVGKYADDKYCYYLIANGKNLRCESASYFKLATGKKHECQSCGYVVFWLKEDIEKIGSSKSVFFLIRKRCARLNGYFSMMIFFG